MIILGQAIVKGARMRDECRGAHYKPEFAVKLPEVKGIPASSPAYREYVARLEKANNCTLLPAGAGSGPPNPPAYEDFMKQWIPMQEQWIKTTIARFTDSGPEISYQPVRMTVKPPRPRIYE